MPKSWWGKTLEGLYVVGYFIYVIAAGVSAWPHMPFMDWWYYMGWQEAVYAPFWPVVVVLQILGVL